MLVGETEQEAARRKEMLLNLMPLEGRRPLSRMARDGISRRCRRACQIAVRSYLAFQ